MWQIIYTGEKKEILPQKLKVLADCTTSLEAFNQGHMIDWLMYLKLHPQLQLETWLYFGTTLILLNFKLIKKKINK